MILIFVLYVKSSQKLGEKEEEMKPPNSKIKNEGEQETFVPSSAIKKDGSIRVIKVVSFMVIFTAGAVIGLSLAAHFSPYLATQTELFFPTKMYSTNCGIKMNNLSLEGFVNPVQAMHTMRDEELFWRASMVPKKKGYPFKRVPKVAFMFMTRGPLPLMRLWEMFFKGHEGMFTVYVHTLPGYNLVVNRSSPFYNRQIPSQETSWGSISLIDAEKRLLANALLDFNNERFVLVSESCIPIYNFPTVYNYLTNSMHSFVDSFDEDSPQGRGRYNRHMWPAIRLTMWRKGSEWFELNRELAVNIVADYKYYRLFSKYCKPSCYPDEHYFPTFLYMFYGALNANRTVTWVDWSRGGPHPAIYGEESITEDFIQSIRNNNGTRCQNNFKPTSVCYLFARKFAPSALDPLLRLASSVMEF